jgi:hypothetical protein
MSNAEWPFSGALLSPSQLPLRVDCCPSVPPHELALQATPGRPPRPAGLASPPPALAQRLQCPQRLRPGFHHAIELILHVLVDRERRSLRRGREGVVLVGWRPGADGFAVGVFNPVGDVAEVPDRDELVRPVRGDLRDPPLPARRQESASPCAGSSGSKGCTPSRATP